MSHIQQSIKCKASLDIRNLSTYTNPEVITTLYSDDLQIFKARLKEVAHLEISLSYQRSLPEATTSAQPPLSPRIPIHIMCRWYNLSCPASRGGCGLINPEMPIVYGTACPRRQNRNGVPVCPHLRYGGVLEGHRLCANCQAN